MFLELVFQVVMSFFACIAFSIIFNAPRKRMAFVSVTPGSNVIILPTIIKLYWLPNPDK